MPYTSLALEPQAFAALLRVMRVMLPPHPGIRFTMCLPHIEAYLGLQEYPASPAVKTLYQTGRNHHPHHPQVFAEPLGHKGLRPVFLSIASPASCVRK